MKTLGANALTEIAKKLGTEPLNIIAIQWKDEVVYYADKELEEYDDEGVLVQFIPGKILALGDIDSVLSSVTATSASVTLTLDDVDNTIKNIIDTTDIHKKPCTVYQYFGDLDLADKFSIFRGQISTPFIWNEGSRQVSFTILSEIEDKEVGFSPEEGQFDFVSPDLEGKPWPLAFGSVLHIPAAKIREVTTGTLKETIGIVDPSLQAKLDSIQQAYFAESLIKAWNEAIIKALSAMCPKAGIVLARYIGVIRLEDAAMLTLNQMQRFIEILKNQRDKNPDPVIKKFLDVQIKQAQQQIVGFSLQLNIIRNQKVQVEALIALLKQVDQLKKIGFKAIEEAVNNMSQLYAQYCQVIIEQCRQSKLEKGVFGVFNGRDFPQNARTDILVKGVRYSGVFTGDTFTVIGEPRPAYENINLAPRQVILNECGFPDEMVGINKFWIENSDISIKDMYILVTSRNTSIRHILKITEQKGTEITYELVQFGSNQGSSGSSGGGGLVNAIGYTFPQYSGPFGGTLPVDLKASGIDPAAGFDLCNNLAAATLSALGVFSIFNLDQTEFQNLTTLQCLAKDDDLGDDLIFLTVGPRDIYTIVGEDVLHIEEVSGVPLSHWFDYNIPREEIPNDLFWVAETGALVLDADRNCEIFVANILPSTIKAINAYRTVDNNRFLAPVPSSYYEKNEANDIGPITITSIKLKQSLLNYGEGWEEQIYVTLVSSVGPNVVDIIEYLIETYTDRTVDATTFNYVRNRFKSGADELYPANFVLTERRNVIQQINEIAWQARCTVWESNGVFYIKYLSEIPTSIETITETDIDVATLQVEFTETEDLTTKLVAKWREHYLPLEAGEEENKVTLRHNVNKYGVHEKEVDFYIYNIQELVVKSATFWLIRLSNTWKKVSFNTYLTKLKIDTLDCITLDFASPYVANEDIKVEVQKCNHSTTDNMITITAWTPVRLGEMIPYEFAWPADIDEDKQFPTNLDIELGFAGGTGIGTAVTGPVSGC